MLTDEEADEIHREVEAGVRGPVLLKWVPELRDDRLGRARPDLRPEEGRKIPGMAAE